ncbi:MULTISPECIES: hypothetical protein [unclassified Mesorhizobium]|uniref:hypothetical protein n=1 Tax=unclassified Mesorhizobium TaxID=325217 RepID=UPI0003CE7F08|nr:MULTISPECIES: hypothetical protein [unclassified Mesorhizobium]ESY49030.1 hypothetical protein X745_28035 [Mesorhizobium sp. LNJC374B00]ESY52732.1 hypothetical protein X744_28565 [Mesorhizobium sp. LNJC372A00]WJI81455.1 hypothetical protein NLY34_01455 [Mesorhizobium sp. C374B]WJI87974.1 hypothetical protein NLY42_03870 [Mesorhizobium sp. C372A]
MLKYAARLIYLAPALTFGLGAAFVAAAYRLGASPADPAAWQGFLALAPLVREPVYLVTGLSGYAVAFVVFAIAALAGAVIAVSSRPAGRARFVHAHLAFLMLFMSMGRAGVFSAGTNASGIGAASPIDWTPDFSGFPALGVGLCAVVALACAASHLSVIRGIIARPTTQQVESRRTTHSMVVAGAALAVVGAIATAAWASGQGPLPLNACEQVKGRLHCWQ